MKLFHEQLNFLRDKPLATSADLYAPQESASNPQASTSAVPDPHSSTHQSEILPNAIPPETQSEDTSPESDSTRTEIAQDISADSDAVNSPKIRPEGTIPESGRAKAKNIVDQEVIQVPIFSSVTNMLFFLSVSLYLRLLG